MLVDNSTPALASQTNGATGPLTTASFTPPANSLLVVMWSGNAVSQTDSPATPGITDSLGTHLTYTLVKLANPSTTSTTTIGGQAAIWTAPVTTSAAMTVTVTNNAASGSRQADLQVFVLTAANNTTPVQSSGVGVLSSAATIFSQTYTPAAGGTGGGIFMAVCDWPVNATLMGAGAGTTVWAQNNQTGVLLSGFYKRSAFDDVAGTANVINGNLNYSDVVLWAWVDIAPATTSSAIPQADKAGAVDAPSIAAAVPVADAAGAIESISVVQGSPIPQADTAGAAEALSYTISQAIPQADKAGAVEGLAVTVGIAPAPTPSPSAKPASPAFIRSKMPRMHCQNLLTGKWFHRDVQGVINPSVTWALNTADAFTCTLSPPRADMMDSSGNPLLQEWRDAIYLEESDEIKFGGILTSSAMTGPAWNLTCAGFMGYPNGLIYEGPDYKRINIDALDVVRYIWDWIQSQPNGNVGMKLGTQKAGVLLGAQIPPGVTALVTGTANAGQPNLWLDNSSAFTNGEQITISGIPYQIRTVVQSRVTNIPTGQIILTQNLGETHHSGDTVTQITAVGSVMSGSAKAGQNFVWLKDASAFGSSMIVTIGGDTYTISNVPTGPTGAALGQLVLTTNLRKAYGAGTKVQQVQAPNPIVMYWYNSTDLGQEINSIRQEAIFDMREVHTWNGDRSGVNHNLVFGIPRLGGRLPHLRFVEGENIIQPATVTRDGSLYASNVVGLGAGTGTAQVRSIAANPNTGRLRRTLIYSDQTVYTNSRMAVKANKQLQARSNIDAVTQIVVKNHKHAEFGSFAPGDDIYVQLRSGWRNTGIWSRITSMTQNPTTDIMTLTLARSDSFTYMTETGQAGTL